MTTDTVMANAGEQIFHRRVADDRNLPRCLDAAGIAALRGCIGVEGPEGWPSQIFVAHGRPASDQSGCASVMAGLGCESAQPGSGGTHRMIPSVATRMERLATALRPLVAPGRSTDAKRGRVVREGAGSMLSDSRTSPLRPTPESAAPAFRYDLGSARLPYHAILPPAGCRQRADGRHGLPA